MILYYCPVSNGNTCCCFHLLPSFFLFPSILTPRHFWWWEWPTVWYWYCTVQVQCTYHNIMYQQQYQYYYLLLRITTQWKLVVGMLLLFIFLCTQHLQYVQTEAGATFHKLLNHQSIIIQHTVLAFLFQSICIELKSLLKTEDWRLKTELSNLNQSSISHSAIATSTLLV